MVSGCGMEWGGVASTAGAAAAAKKKTDCCTATAVRALFLYSTRVTRFGYTYRQLAGDHGKRPPFSRMSQSVSQSAKSFSESVSRTGIRR